MASLDMDGPYRLTKTEVLRVVTIAMPGCFALGRRSKDGRFVVRYIGRDDSDLRRALLSCAGKENKPAGLFSRKRNDEGDQDYFKFSFAQDAGAAYEKQCRSYHDFNTQGRLRNSRHPRPPRKGMRCPICGAD